MKRISLRRPSPALVISCIALFVSLSGVSWALATGVIDSREIKNNTIRTQDLRNNEVRTGDIRNSTIRGRDVAVDTITGADVNESLLGVVPNAAALGGSAPTAFAKTKQEAVKAVTAFEPGFSAAAGFLAPGYWKDAFGVVHLEGSVDVPGAGGAAFTLPVGYRPAWKLVYPRRTTEAANNITTELVTITTDGKVDLSFGGGSDDVSLDGIAFRVP